MTRATSNRRLCASAVSAEPLAIELTPGVAIGPFSVGSSGVWRVDGAGVRDEHAFLYFDGATLFVQSIEDGPPALVDGRPLPLAWTPLATSSVVTIGGASLWLGEGSDALDEPAPASGSTALMAAPPPSARRPPPRPDVRFAVEEPTGATKMAPIEEMLAQVQARRAALPAPGNPTIPMPAVNAFALDARAAHAPPMLLGAAAQQAPGPTPPPFPSPPPAPPSSLGGMTYGAYAPAPHAAAPISYPPAPTMPSPRLEPIASPPTPSVGPVHVDVERPREPVALAWKRMPIARKVIVLLSPVVLASIVVLLADSPNTARGAEIGPKAAVTSSASAPIAASVPSADPSATPATTSALPPAAIDSPGPVLPKPSSPAEPASASSAAPSTKTLERAAADAVAAGSFAEAAAIYQRLAREHPENPAFKEAARIVSIKAQAQGR